MVSEPDASSPQSAAPSQRLRSRTALSLVAFILLAVPGALTLLLVQGGWPPLMRADGEARDDLHSYALTNTTFVDVMQMISASGSGLAWVVILAAVVAWLLWCHLPRLALFIVITAAGSSLLNSVVKAAVHRPRPVLSNPVAQESTYSFPSGHAQAAIVGYAVLLLIFLPMLHRVWKKIAITLAVFMVLAIGFSRIALGVHYLSDVMAGLILGAAWVAAMMSAFNALSLNAMRDDIHGRLPERQEKFKPAPARPMRGRATG